ncbi:MAG: alpha/beta fold hydrolase [Burkholderiales bacterium]
MATFVVAHGAWSAGWVWKKMRPLMRGFGHEIFTPTYTGLGERVHLANPSIDLETHIADILGVLEAEDLHDVFLIGHSYGGMVATGVADRAAQRIKRLIYLDAFAPKNGQSLLDLGSPVRPNLPPGEWRIAPNPPPPDTPASDLEWIAPRRVPHPAKCMQQKLALSGAVEKLPRSYIYCTRPAPSDNFRQFAERAKKENWQYLEIDASHNPHVTNPGTLARMLDRIATGRWPTPVKASR